VDDLVIQKPESMLRPFDYTFFRIAHYLRQKYGHTYGWFEGVFFVTLLQLVILLDCVFIPLFYLVEVSKAQKTALLWLIAVLVMVGNLYRYSKILTYSKAQERWQEESTRQRRTRRWLILLCYLVSYSLLPLMPGLLLPHIFR
jgi:hypothetical protein